MLKVLLALETCGKYRTRRFAQRKTWLKFMPADLHYRYFTGVQDGASVTIPSDEEDVTTLLCPDGYNELILKTRSIIAWAVEREYDYLFKTDDDTYVDAHKLLASGFQHWEYSGWSRQREYAQGGSGYWLSRRAMLHVLHDKDGTPDTIQEDQHIGKVLQRCNIFPVHDPRYQVGPGPGRESFLTRSDKRQAITLHRLLPIQFDEVHAFWLDN